jgi:hypothetical protein
VRGYSKGVWDILGMVHDVTNGPRMVQTPTEHLWKVAEDSRSTPKYYGRSKIFWRFKEYLLRLGPEGETMGLGCMVTTRSAKPRGGRSLC